MGRKTPKSIAEMVAEVESTIKAIENIPPEAGGKWREGMLRYWRNQLLALRTAQRIRSERGES